jgi:hypothetical protein
MLTNVWERIIKSSEKLWEDLKDWIEYRKRLHKAHMAERKLERAVAENKRREEEALWNRGVRDAGYCAGDLNVIFQSQYTGRLYRPVNDYPYHIANDRNITVVEGRLVDDEWLSSGKVEYLDCDEPVKVVKQLPPPEKLRGGLHDFMCE